MLDKVVGGNRLGEDVCRVVFRCDPDEVGLSEFDAFSDGVIVDVDMLNLPMSFFAFCNAKGGL